MSASSRSEARPRVHEREARVPKAAVTLPPDGQTLRRLYVEEDLPLIVLAERFGVGKDKVRTWLVAAGIPIRTRAQAGRRRQLQAPSAQELARLYQLEGLTLRELAGRLGVNHQTARRWILEAGIALRTAPLAGLCHGQGRVLSAPGPEELHRLYVDENLSLAQVARALGATTHLVRTWLVAAGIPARPPGGKAGVAHKVPVRKPAPPRAELEEAWLTQRATRRDIAQRYGVSLDTVRRWLGAAGLRGPRPPAPLRVPVEELVALYEDERLSHRAIAQLTGIPDQRVAAALAGAGVRPDRAGRLGTQRAVAAAKAAAPALSGQAGIFAEEAYVWRRWSLTRIAEALGVSPRRVRRHLVTAGVQITRHPNPSRADRMAAPAEEVEALYVGEGLTSAQAGEILELDPKIVLRTGRDHGLPIRPGGVMVIPAEVRLIDELYTDEAVVAVLDRHGVPRRRPGGGIAERFPEPVPVSRELLVDLHEAGCSSGQMEVLTGQSAHVLRRRMAEWGIPLSHTPVSPALRRFRKARRQAFLADIATRYAELGSTVAVAAEVGCATETVRRWLGEVGVSVPGRGRWPRGQRVTD